MKAQRDTVTPQSTPLRIFLTIGVALLVAGMFSLTGDTRGSASTQRVNLPTLRLPYLVCLVCVGPVRNNFDPIFLSSTNEAVTDSLTNASLVQVLPNGRVAPDLATWKVSKNGLVYTFTIRTNARFSNGRYVNSRDAEYSIKRYLSPATGDQNVGPEFNLIRGFARFRAGKTKVFTGMRVLSKRVLQITTTRPAAYFLVATLAQVQAEVLDPTVVAGKFLGTPNRGYFDGYLNRTCAANQGAGPFKFVCRNAGSTRNSFYPPGPTPTYTFVPNPYYYGPKPHIRVEVPAFKDDFKPYLKGQLDVTGVPAAYLRLWKGRSSQYHHYPSSAVYYLFPNVHLAPFDNVHCRLAVAYAVDRDTLANNVLHGTGRSTYAIVPKGMLGYSAGKDNPQYNPSRARAELSKCPGRTTPFELVYSTAGQPEARNEFTAIRNMLNSVGMNAQLKLLSFTDWSTIVSQPLDKTRTQIAYFGWVEDYPDPNDYFTYVLPPDGNIGGWRNADYSRLVDRAAMTLNRKTRASLYVQAQHVALGRGALIPMSEGIASFLIKPYLHGLVNGPFSLLVAKNNDWSNVSISKH